MTDPLCALCGRSLPLSGARFCSFCGASQLATGAAHGAGEVSVTSPQGASPAQPGAFDGATVIAGTTALLHIQDGARLETVALSGEVISLGRRPDSNVVIGAPFVSGRHARLERVGTTHRIIDVGSTNGLVFNGARIETHELADGDVLRIPDPSTANFISITYVNPLAPRVAQASRVARRYPAPRDATVATLGRSGTEIVLESPLVSRRHAQIGWHVDRHYLRDLGSANGTHVNGNRVRDVVPLAAGDVIQIGPFKLRYDGDSLDEYDQRGAMRIDARDLRRVVPSRTGSDRVILDDVSLSIEPREFVALVGGSGAGKSTLMMALSGYARADQGEVRVNGDDYYRNFDAYRSVLGYVPQDDIIHRMLPVERALRYSARLKLPADTGDDEIEKRVERVLEAVDMSAHRDKLIEQLSGGQRKRVSIASELLNDPSLLFLDEPTSGLDPGLEKKMMFTLRQLADTGRTVVLVTHATANITQCDLVAFMAGGRLVYFGPPADALPFFGVTSSDFADIYTRLEGDAASASPLVQKDLHDEATLWQSRQPDSTRTPHLAELWEIRWKRSPHYQKYVVDRLARTPPGPKKADVEQSSAADSGGSIRRSWFRQFAILTRRYLDLTMLDSRNLAIMLLQAPIIGALLCMVSHENVITGREQPYDTKKLLFLISTVGVWFGIINSAREICKESTVFRRERLASLRVVPYVASKFAVLLALVLVQSALLLGVIELKVAMPDYGVFSLASLEMYVTTVLSGLAGIAFGLLISALSSTPDKAISAVPLALVPQILFAGLLFRLEGTSSILSWLTASRWAMDAFGSIVDLNGFRWANGLPVTFESQYEHTVEHVFACWGLLLAYAAVCSIAIGSRLHRRQ